MKFRCDTDIYCPTPDLFDSVTEFTDMCLFVFGEAPVLRRATGGRLCPKIPQKRLILGQPDPFSVSAGFSVSLR